MSRAGKVNGFTMAELIMALAVLTVLLTSFAMALGTFSAVNHFYMSKQRCIAAAQAQLDSISVTGRPLPDNDFKNLWPLVELSIHKSQGSGQWQGLTLVSVKTTAKTCGRTVTVELSRYISQEPQK